MSRIVSVALGVVVSLGKVFAGTAYTVTILGPIGAVSEADSVSGTTQVGSINIDSTPVTHAVRWSGASSTMEDLNPTGYTASAARGTSGGQVVGSGYAQIAGSWHALLWPGGSGGGAGSYVDLNPFGFTSTDARGIASDNQVGWGTGPLTGGLDHALLWHGAAATASDLNPAALGFTSSKAWATTTEVQVGGGAGPLTGGLQHALMWRGSAGSAIDLHPAGAQSSYAFGASGDAQVGAVDTTAALWRGTPDSVVLLPAPGFDTTYARGISGDVVVGYGDGLASGGSTHALAWYGTADPAVDLNEFLPDPMRQYGSRALGIGEDGEIVGYAYTMPGLVAVRWAPVVPEPVWAGLLAAWWLVATDVVGRKRLEMSSNGENAAKARWRPRKESSFAVIPFDPVIRDSLPAMRWHKK